MVYGFFHVFLFFIAGSGALSVRQASPDSTHFEIFWSILFPFFFVAGLKYFPLLLFLLPAFLFPVSFIVTGPDTIENVVFRGGKLQ